MTASRSLLHVPVSVSVGLWFGLGLQVPASLADQVCVTCSDPSAVYLCNIEPGAELLAGTGGQLACLTELAKRGGHEKCSVMRQSDGRCDGLAPVNLYPDDGTAADTTAETLSQPSDAAPTDNRPATQPAAEAPDDFQADIDDQNKATKPTPKQADDNGKAPAPPKTVAEMADRAFETSKKNIGEAGEAVSDGAEKTGSFVTDTAKKTGEQIGKAGKAIGTAAQKTWQCVTSLFSNC